MKKKRNRDVSIGQISIPPTVRTLKKNPNFHRKIRISHTAVEIRLSRHREIENFSPMNRNHSCVIHSSHSRKRDGWEEQTQFAGSIFDVRFEGAGDRFLNFTADRSRQLIRFSYRILNLILIEFPSPRDSRSQGRAFLRQRRCGQRVRDEVRRSRSRSSAQASLHVGKPGWQTGKLTFMDYCFIDSNRKNLRILRHSLRIHWFELAN